MNAAHGIRGWTIAGVDKRGLQWRHRTNRRGDGSNNIVGGLEPAVTLGFAGTTSGSWCTFLNMRGPGRINQPCGVNPGKMGLRVGLRQPPISLPALVRPAFERPPQ
jgi:hypothetical protein